MDTTPSLTAPYFEFRAGGAGDQHGAHAAAILEAYIAAEQAAVFRQLAYRRLAAAAVLACLLWLFTPILPAAGLTVALSACGAGWLAVMRGTQRARRRLRELLGPPRSVG
jgi:hypothetical protein